MTPLLLAAAVAALFFAWLAAVLYPVGKKHFDDEPELYEKAFRSAMLWLFVAALVLLARWLV